MCTMEAVSGLDFMPVKSEAKRHAAEVAGKFEAIAPPGSDNRYDIDTGNLLICPFVAPEA
jgi:hypothetical protein